ncbi:MAG: hypothetical protein QT10_C0007G0085 [archaeon GW2011_AR19]|nr:MAG: hypothetical protein QT10_C0007G0085 [archaeon GW2011_AR19]
MKIENDKQNLHFLMELYQKMIAINKMTLKHSEEELDEVKQLNLPPVKKGYIDIEKDLIENIKNRKQEINDYEKKIEELIKMSYFI